jgi:hypothetical protein
VVLDSDEFVLNTDNPQLLPTALDAKCDTRAFNGALSESTDRDLLAKGCQARMAKRLGAKHGLFWGYVYLAPGGKRFAKVHFWQPTATAPTTTGETRTATLPYDDGDRRRLAERLYRHLVWPGKVGDVRVVGPTGGAPVRGELFAAGRSAGPFHGTEAELTLPTGETSFEVRAGDRVLARGRTVVASGASADVRLEPVADPPAVAPAPAPGPPDVGAAPAIARRRARVLPWVFGGVGVAGLAGAGAFLALRQGERSDLAGACAGEACPRGRADAIDRGNLYGTLSVASLGVGIAGAGLLTYVLVRDARATSTGASGRWVVGSLRPLPGGATLSVGGGF